MFALSLRRRLDHISFYQWNAIMRSLEAAADESLCIHFERPTKFMYCAFSIASNGTNTLPRSIITRELCVKSSASSSCFEIKDWEKKSSKQSFRELSRERESLDESGHFHMLPSELVVYRRFVATVDCRWRGKLVKNTWRSYRRVCFREKFPNVANWFIQL